MNTHRQCSEELFEKRKARMLKLLEMNAPDIIIATEARLLCNGFHGGMWRNIWQAIEEAARADFRWYVATPFMRLLCRLNIYHAPPDAASGLGCDYCGRGETFRLLDEDSE